MLKIATLLAFLCVTTPAFAINSELTGKTMLDSDVVTVGDLFTNAGGHTNHVLAPTPVAGQKLVLSKDDLLRVASAFELDWQAPDTVTVTLERDATLVTIDNVTAALAASDLQSRVATGVDFKISNLSDDILISGKTVPDLKISNITFDDVTEKFTADLHIMRGGVLLKTLPLTGVATQMVMVPILRLATPAGNVITEADLVQTPVPKTQMRGGTILAMNDLIGMTTKRSMVARQGITRADIIPPVMVKRNDMVTIMYNSGPVALSTKARSLGNGTVGDTVTFMNTTSKKPFTAKVTGPNQAEVNVNI